MQHSHMRKVWSTLLIGVLALAGLLGVQSVATAATIAPVAAVVGTPSAVSGNNLTVWYKWTYSAGDNYFTVKTCDGSKLGGNNQTLSIYKSTNASLTDDSTLTAVSTGITTSACGKGLQVTIDLTTAGITTGDTAYFKLVTAGATDFLTKFSRATSGPAAPASYVELDRVTICHRTHATTNPYRIITVSASSIVGSYADGSPIRGHAKHAPDARRYVEDTDPTKYGPYDSSRSYKPSEKYWEDIIPPFKDASTGGEFPGLNWTWGAISTTDTILDKTEFGSATASGSSSAVNQSAVDLCKGTSGDLTSSQYFDIERKNGGQKRQDILDELTDTDQYEPDVYKDRKDVDSKIPAKEGPKSTPVNNISQSLDGVVWLDINRNGFQESNEPYMSNIKITVSKGNSPALALGGRFTGFGTGAKVISDTFGASKIASFIDSQVNRFGSLVNSVRALFGMATTFTVYTDANGYFLFKSLDAGDWYVVGVVPAGLDVTYDSAGIADATVDTTVPAGGHASTWIGLMGDGTTGINSKVYNPDGTPATKDVVITASGIDGIFCNADDVSFIITPVNGVIELSGLPNSSFYVRQIGTTSTIADFDITTGQIYTKDIRTVKGLRCALLGKNLAATGANVTNKTAGAIALVAIGSLLSVIGFRRRKASAV